MIIWFYCEVIINFFLSFIQYYDFIAQAREGVSQSEYEGKILLKKFISNFIRLRLHVCVLLRIYSVDKADVNSSRAKTCGFHTRRQSHFFW